jgi:hypothetical protein
MEAFVEDGVLVLHEVLDKLGVAAAVNIVGEAGEIGIDAGLPRVIVNLPADGFELGGLGALVLEYVENYVYAEVVEGTNFVINVNYASVVWGIGCVEGDDVEGMESGEWRVENFRLVHVIIRF